MKTILRLNLDNDRAENVYPCTPVDKNMWRIGDGSFLDRIEDIISDNYLEDVLVWKDTDEVCGETRFFLSAVLSLPDAIEYASIENGKLVLLFNVTPPDPDGVDRPQLVIPTFHLNVDDPNAECNRELFHAMSEPD